MNRQAMTRRCTGRHAAPGRVACGVRRAVAGRGAAGARNRGGHREIDPRGGLNPSRSRLSAPVMQNEPSHTETMGRPARWRGFLPASLAAFVLVSLSPDEGGALVITAPVAGQPQAASCVASLPWFGHEQGWYTAPRGRINTSNDGGWCDLQFIQFFRQVYSKDQPTISVVEPPSHGEVTAERLSDRLAVAYRPAPGFVGTDHFSVRTDGPIPHTIPIEVTVR